MIFFHQSRFHFDAFSFPLCAYNLFVTLGYKIYIEFNYIKMYTKYEIVPFCPIPFCTYTILSIPFCPYHFVRYHFVRSPMRMYEDVGRGGALVESMTLSRRAPLSSSHVGTLGLNLNHPLLKCTAACALRRETPI